LGLFKTGMMLLQAHAAIGPGILTLFVDWLVLVLGQDSVVGLDLVLLEHGLIAIVCQSVSFVSYRVDYGEIYPRAVHHGGQSQFFA